MSQATDQFIEALHRLEETCDEKPIAALFAQGADISNPMVKHEGAGEGGAAEFWKHYRAAFKTIRSEFRNVVEQDRVAMLEWVSEASTEEGPTRYGGVSVLEHGDGGIVSFRAYFNPPSVKSSATK